MNDKRVGHTEGGYRLSNAQRIDCCRSLDNIPRGLRITFIMSPNLQGRMVKYGTAFMAVLGSLAILWILYKFDSPDTGVYSRSS